MLYIGHRIVPTSPARRHDAPYGTIKPMPDIPGSIPGTPPRNSTSNSTVRSIPVQRSYYPILLALFVVVFIISNVTATKGVALGPLITDGAFFLFPVAYVIATALPQPGAPFGRALPP